MKNGPKGDLYIFVSVREHELFERDGQTLFARAPVPMVTAAMGGEIEMPLIAVLGFVDILAVMAAILVLSARWIRKHPHEVVAVAAPI